MRKQTKIVAALSATALLAIGASMTSFAATGWQEENGTWVYYDRDGILTTNDWAKSGDLWFYLGDDGEMVTDQIVEYNENYYYVDVNGAMVTNRWVEVENTDNYDEDAAPICWYYFQANGKAMKGKDTTSFKTINGKKYAFDAEGKMLYGWIDNTNERLTGDDAWERGVYYLGDYNDGSQKTGEWQLLNVIDADAEDEDQQYWFYFGSNGKKYYNTEKTINGKKYHFNVKGAMDSEWVDVSATPTDATKENVASYKYYSSPEDGARKTRGWFRVLPDKAFNLKDSDEEEGNARWFYADGKGNVYQSVIKTINGKKYAFDDKGSMISGLKYLEVDGTKILGIAGISSEDDMNACTGIDTTVATNYRTGVYYFGDEATDGSMKTGLLTVTVDGEAYTMKFKASGSAKGVGISGKEKDGFYINGRKLKADADLRYEALAVDANGKVVAKVDSLSLVKSDVVMKNSKGEPIGKGKKDAINLPAGADHVEVITTSGALIKGGTKKDGNDVYLILKNSKVIGAYYLD